MFKQIFKDALVSYCQRVPLENFPDPALIGNSKVKLTDLFQSFSSFHINLVPNAEEKLNQLRDKGFVYRVAIIGRPGDGKSTFLRMLLTSYIENDISFFEEANDVLYTIRPDKMAPVYVELGKLSSFDYTDMKSKSLSEICFDIAKQTYLRDVDISAEDFQKIFEESKLICADAFDEINNPDKEKLFLDKLSDVYKDKNIITTCREEKEKTLRELELPYEKTTIGKSGINKENYELNDFSDNLEDTHNVLDKNKNQTFRGRVFDIYYMPDFSEEDRNSYVRKYYKLIGREERSEDIIKKINSGPFSFIKDLSRSPMNLSLLLASIESGNGGYLPRNISDLIAKMVDRFLLLYSLKERANQLSPSTLKIFLRYLAMNIFMLNSSNEISVQDALYTIGACKNDKDGLFHENLYGMENKTILEELLNTGIILQDGNYIFFGMHKLILEYFIACGLATDFVFFKDKIAFEKFNKVFENVDHYIRFCLCFDINRARMPVVLYLLQNPDKVKKLIDDLLYEPFIDGFKYDEEAINIFLLELVTNNVVIEKSFIEVIFSKNFKKIDFRHNKRIYQIVALDNTTSKEFVSYIESESKQAFQKQTTDFIDTLAIINLHRNEPFEHMENLFSSGDEFSVWLATKMLTELTRIKTGDTFISKITPAREAVNAYRIGSTCAEAIVRIYKTSTNGFLLDELSYVLALSCILEITSFSELFTDENFDYLVSELNKSGKNVRYFEILLGIADINKLSYKTSVSEEVKKRFLNEYRQHISGWEINSVYSFVKCVRSGCFTHENYSYVDFRELKSVVAANLYGRLSSDDFPTNNCPQEMLLERIKRDLLFEKVFICNKNTYKAIFKDAEFSLTDIERLLFVEDNEDAICNNLSSLLRRGLVQEVTKNGQVVTETYLNANNGDFLSTINESLLKVGLNKEFYDWLHNTNLSEESDLMVGASNYYEKLAAEYSQRIKVFFEKIQEAYEFLLSKKFTLTKEDAFACIYSWSEPKNGERDFEGFVLLTLLWKFDEFIFDEYCVEDKDNFIDIGSLARDFLKSGLASQDVFWGVFSALYTTHLKRYCIDKLLEKDLDDTAEFKLIEGKIYAVIDKYIFYKDYDCMLCGNNEGEYYFLYYDEAQKKEIVIEDKESMKSVLYDFYENILE